MDNPTTLLVAIMYVTIVATGLVNLLMTLSDLVAGRRKLDPLHTGWIVFLFFCYLGFFWETTVILDVEGWNFLSFVMFIAGPIALLFATDMILSAGETGATSDQQQLRNHYINLSKRFYALLLVVQVWIVGLDLVFDNWGVATYLTIFMCLCFGGLMLSRQARLHAVVLGLVSLALHPRIIVTSHQEIHRQYGA